MSVCAPRNTCCSMFQIINSLSGYVYQFVRTKKLLTSLSESDTALNTFRLLF